MPRNNIINPFERTDMFLWKSNSKPCLLRKDIYDRNIQLIDMMTNKYPKVYFFRLDIRFPDGYNVDFSNACRMLSSFFESYMHSLVDYYHQNYQNSVDFRYRRAFELNQGSVLPHAHAFVVANGKYVHSIFNLLTVAESVWNKILGGSYPGLIDWCRQEERCFNREQYHNNGIMIDRNKPDYQDLLHECYRWSSYLAKIDGKDRFPPHTHIHDGSQF